MRRIFDWFRALLVHEPSRSYAPRLPAPAPGRDLIEERLAASRVPGAALAVVEDGAVAWAAGYGHVKRSTHSPYVTPDTVFQAASLSKPVTALAVLDLVGRGVLDLDEDVRPLLQLPLVEHPILAAQPGRRRPVTARLLLQHRGGIVGRGTTPGAHGSLLGADRGGGSRRIANRPGVRVPTLEDSWYGNDGSAPVTITYAPGTQVSYSGAGYLVLQHLIENLTGAPFARHMAVLLGRLGARAASFDLHPPPSASFAHGHDADGRPLPGGHELVPWSAAGGLYASAYSVAEILTAIVTGGAGVVEPGLVQRMWTENLGVFARRESNERLFRHGGDNGGFRAAMAGWPMSGAGAVVLTNGRSSDGMELRRELMSIIAPQPGPR